MLDECLIYDIETDSLDINKAKLKYFGAYSFRDKKYYKFDFKKNVQIQDLIKSHKILISFNGVNYDNPIIERHYPEIFKYKIIIDLWEQLSPKGKNKLANMGVKLNSFSLNNICKNLFPQLKTFKGDIDYNIFKKDEWTKEEVKEIEKYLQQDINLTRELFEWYYSQFKPLEEFLSEEQIKKAIHLKSSLSVIGYNAICNLASLPVVYSSEKKNDHQTFAGGHHLEHRWSKVSGDIVEIDFTSAYPHAFIQANLFSQEELNGWTGNNYYKINGKYNNKQLGKIEEALKNVFLKRLEAKKKGDNLKSTSYKVVINSVYGITGNSTFTSLYNPVSAADCTSIVRTWMKKMAKHLEENGFTCLYGFTDSLFVLIPKESSKDELMFIVNKVLEEFKENLSFPQDTFKMGIDEELSFIWFISKNCYLRVTKEGNIKYTSTLFNKNTPQIVLNILENYVFPRIKKEHNINLSVEEVEYLLKSEIEKDISLCSEQYKTNSLSEYKSKTSIQYQIVERYGENSEVKLIPNKKKIGIGKGKSYCTLEEFNESGLGVDDIDLKKLISYFKPFFKDYGEVLI